MLGRFQVNMQRKNWQVFSQCIEITRDSIKLDNFIAWLSAKVDSCIVCIVVSTPLENTPPPPSFLPSPPLKSAKFPSPPPFTGNYPLYIGYFVNFREPPLKIWFFSEPQKYSSFSTLTPSCLLKRTKFLVRVSQFEFFVMTEKNIFVIKYFRY